MGRLDNRAGSETPRRLGGLARLLISLAQLGGGCAILRAICTAPKECAGEPSGTSVILPTFPALNNLRKKSSRAQKTHRRRGHIFNDLTARLKGLRKKSHCGSRLPSAAKAAIDFATLTARLKPRPFKAKSRTRVFPQPVKSCPSQTPSESEFFRKLLDVHRRSSHLR